MITRAQAEALLTLAESLEACERADLRICIPNRCNVVLQGGTHAESLSLRSEDCSMNAMHLRVLLSDIVPKHTGS